MIVCCRVAPPEDDGNRIMPALRSPARKARHRRPMCAYESDTARLDNCINENWVPAIKNRMDTAPSNTSKDTYQAPCVSSISVWSMDTQPLAATSSHHLGSVSSEVIKIWWLGISMPRCSRSFCRTSSTLLEMTPIDEKHAVLSLHT